MEFYVLKFDTWFGGGGIAFVPTTKTEEEAKKLVLENIRYNWEAEEVEIIGMVNSNNLDLTKLTQEYYYDKDKEEYINLELWHYGGDCC